MVKKVLCGLTADEIFHRIRPGGYTMKHALLISNAIYKKRISSISQILKIPRDLIAELNSDTEVGVFPSAASEISSDKTIKYLFRTSAGKEFETVYMSDGKRNTVCISTQSGCRMACPFCITAKYGFHGDLSAGEMINQVISLPDAKKVTHVVFMGMGEPMDNLGNVLKACDILTSGWGLALSPRNITVSTVGITPGIEKFLSDSRCNLTVSLHSPFSDERKLIIPVEKKYPVNNIVGILKNYTLTKKRRFTLAYVMIRGFNDTDLHLEALKNLVMGSKIRVNLIPYHIIPGDQNTSSPQERMYHFKHNLVLSGVSASIRKSRGLDISAACGLLATGLRK